MAYSVYAIAAAEFTAAFYEALFTGQTASAATTAGRRQPFARDRRPSPRGVMPLADWLVPVRAGAPIMRVVATVYDTKGRPLEIQPELAHDSGLAADSGL